MSGITQLVRVASSGCRLLELPRRWVELARELGARADAELAVGVVEVVLDRHAARARHVRATAVHRAGRTCRPPRVNAGRSSTRRRRTHRGNYDRAAALVP